jgi:hypothetical protein
MTTICKTWSLISCGLDLRLFDHRFVERKAALVCSKACIKAAVILGANAVLVMPGTVDVPFNPERPVVPAKQAWELALASVQA